MTTSDQINEIAGALAKAQGEMGGAKKDAANPFFKSKYADLASVWDACRSALSANGLAVIQSPSVARDENGTAFVSVETVLTHSSGQFFRDTIIVAAKEDSPQAVGSAITYLRRYALQSFAGVAPEDDDAEAAQGRGTQQAKAQGTVSPIAPKGFTDWLIDMESVVEEGTARLTEAWKNSKAEYRQFLTSTAPKQWEAMKAGAARATVNQVRETVSR